MPKGGRSLDYTFKGFVFTVFFGQDGKVGGFMLTEGLEDKGYGIDRSYGKNRKKHKVPENNIFKNCG